MKKFFTLSLACLMAGIANAQLQHTQSVVFEQAPKMQTARHFDAPFTRALRKPKTSFTKSAAKTTDGDYADWYYLWDQYYVAGTSVGYYYEVYPDSNLYNGTFYTYARGLGMSFDPTDSAYGYFGAYTVSIVSQPMPDTAHYMIDSIYVPMVYENHNLDTTVIDSIILDLIIANPDTVDSGAYLLRFTTPESYFYPITYDSTPRFASALYDNVTGDVFPGILADRQRFAFAVNWSSVKDTDANGLFTPFYLGLPNPLHVRPGGKVISYVHFVSGVHYPLGTSVNSANLIHLFAGQPLGAGQWFMQSAHNDAISYRGSYQDGLIAQNQLTYSDTGFAYMGHNILIPSCAFANSGTDAPPGMQVTEVAFHVVWPDGSGATNVDSSYYYSDMHTTGVNTVNNHVISAAYPNPAGSDLIISFTCTQPVTATVALYNTLGQIVAQKDVSAGKEGKVLFNVSKLPDGVYYYNIVAGSQTVTGRVAVAH